MRTDKPGLHVISTIMVILLLVGCGTPTQTPVPPTPEPTAVPTSSPVPPTPEPVIAPTVAAPKEGEEWDYVAIGDGDMWGFFKDYAAHLEADLGAKVTVHDYHLDGMTSVSLLTRLRKNKGLRQALGDAEVVTFAAKPMDRVGWLCITEERPDFDCSQESLAAFEEDYRAIVAEIASLRGGSETIIRTMDLYMPYYSEWRERGIFDECWRCWEAVNESIQRVAAEYGIPLAPVHDTFNGPDHDQDPKDKGYVNTEGAGVRLFKGDVNEMGQAVIADLVRELGYEPMILRR